MSPGLNWVKILFNHRLLYHHQPSNFKPSNVRVFEGSSKTFILSDVRENVE